MDLAVYLQKLIELETDKVMDGMDEFMLGVAFPKGMLKKKERDE